MRIDFKALMKLLEPWPKGSDFGHLHYRKKTADNACNPVLLILGVVGLVLDRQQVAQQLTTQLEGLMGPAGRDLITNILTTTSPQGGALATIIGLVTLFIGATAVFGELQATMNLIWEVQPAPTSGVWAGIWAWLRQRIFSLALVLALAFLLLVSLVISAVLASAAALFHGAEQALLSRLLELAVSLLVLTCLFALLYAYVPDAEIGWRDVWEQLPGNLSRKGFVPIRG
jgi:membrane protein